MKIRSGVVSSQWAGECGENSFEATTVEFAEFALKQIKASDENKKKETLTPGDVVDAEYTGTDPETLDVTEVVQELQVGSSEYKGWVCDRCSSEGCAHCNDGFKFGEDRFVRRLGVNNLPYICLTRYYEILRGES